MSLQESDLAILLNDPIVRDCYLWKVVGLELALKKSTLDVIAKDHPNQTEECTTEMLDTWLKNCEDPRLEDLHQAIRRVNERHLREEHRKCIKDEEKQALAAVNQVKTLLQEWKERNEKIAEDHKSLQEELEKEQEWLSIAKKWKQEENEWQQGEDGIRRNKLETALKEGNFRSSSFVQLFINGKNIQLSDLNNPVVEGLLLQDLMDIDISRSTTLLKQYKKLKEHYNRLKHLQQELVESNKLIEERLLAYDKIKKGLEKLGVKQNKLEELDKQLQWLRHTAEKHIAAKEHFDNIYHESKNNITEHQEQMHVQIERLDSNHKLMIIKESGFSTAYSSTIMGTVASGAVAGATIGLVPGMGTVVSAAVGALVNTAIGYVFGLYKQQHEQIHDETRKYKETSIRAKQMHSKLQNEL